MPRKRILKLTRRTTESRRGRAEKFETQEPFPGGGAVPQVSAEILPKVLTVRWLFVAAILVLLAGFIWINKGLIVAGMVNNRPIFRWDLEKRLISRYGSQTMDEMVNERLLTDEAAKRQVSVSSVEVDNKISDVEKSLKGKVTLKDALSQQGMTMDDLRHQLGLQLLVEKITSDQAKVSDAEVSDYLAKNKDTMISTEEGQLRQEAKDAIIRDKRNKAFQDLFGSLKKSAKVLKFI